MKTVFQGERNAATNGSVLTGVHQSLTPPDEFYPTPPSSFSSTDIKYPMTAEGWMEFWDYAGRTSFRAFVANDGGNEKSLFAFFDGGLLNDGRDLKQALIALIELADGPLGCAHIVLCLERDIAELDAKALVRNLQWAGFELTTLDHWAKDVDVTSPRWLFMAVEV
jgi:hypothetical protein